jgi:D-3-phosphoglycerate dehydrogenase
MSDKYFVIDFDSTFIQFEALDELAAIALQDKAGHEERLDKIRQYTNLAMEGKLSFPESLQKRIELLEADQSDINQLVKVLRRNISTSIQRNEAFFEEFSDRIYVISGGFKEYIAPIVGDYHIDPDHIFANTFTFNEEGRIDGFDHENFLAQENGKVRQLANLNIKGDIYVIGDGYTDFEIRESGLASGFYAFTENVERASLLEKADHVTPNFDEFLFKNELPRAISYPKNRLRAAIMSNLPNRVSEGFSEEGYALRFIPASSSKERLTSEIEQATILAIDPETTVTAEMLNRAQRLLAIGIYGTETGNVDMDAARQNGIVVFHAPHTSTRSVAEMAIGEMLTLLRQVPYINNSLHHGLVPKNRRTPQEIFGKTLGLIGYGSVGKQIGSLAEALGMEICFYDPQEVEGLGNAKPCRDLQELLTNADIISLHITDTEQNRNFIDEEAFEWMKEGAIFLNMSSEVAVDHGALAMHLKSGRLAGAGIDRFPETDKPPHDYTVLQSHLRHLPNVILTPHISGYTTESKAKTASFVTDNIISFINSGSVDTGANFPDIQLPPFDHAHRLIHIHQDYPGTMAEIARIFAEHNINITGQYLKTMGGIGYMITDISHGYDEHVVDAIKNIPHTIRLRILY